MGKFDIKSDGEISMWNEAMFKMRRLDQEQMIINSARHNPLGNDLMSGKFNYEVWFSSLCNLYAEGRPKYKGIEREEMDSLKKAIQMLISKFHPFKTKKTIKMGKTTHVMVLDDVKWKVLEGAIGKFEDEVRRLNDEHGLSTGNQENMDGYSIIR